MSIHLSPIPSTLPRFRAQLAARRASRTPKLADYPDLALAATATTAELDTESDAFAGVQATLEALSRLRLGHHGAFILTLLARHGPQPLGGLATRLRVSSASMTGFADRLDALGLVSFTHHASDRRVILIQATEAARKVLASIVALTALGQAANSLRKKW